MRVLIATGIYPPETGGPATFVPALAADWSSHGWDITVVTYGDAQTKRASGWKVEVVARTGGPIARYLRYLNRVRVLAKEVDMVFLQGPFSDGLPGTIGAMLAGRPTMLRVPGDFAWEGMQREQAAATQSLETFLAAAKPLKWRCIFWLESLIARRARAVVTPSRYLQKLATAWGVAEARKHVVYNTVELDLNLPSRAELRAQFGFGEGQTILLSNARGVPWKRVDFLLEVLHELPETYRLVHVGEGPEIVHWKQLAIDLGVASRVEFLGRVPYLKVQQLARASDAFLLPSLYEGFPHVAVEAACHGLPCFLSDQGGNPEAESQYPERIRILPYANKDAWRQALEQIPPVFEPIPPQPFSEVANAYAAVLKDAC